MPIRPENRDRYPADWAVISFAIRFERARGRCECVGECGRNTHRGRCPNLHGRPAYATGSTVVLTTAHLDHQPENCDPANLRAMCQGCHLHYDRDHHAQTRATTHAADLASWMQPLPLPLDLPQPADPQPSQQAGQQGGRRAGRAIAGVTVAGLRIALTNHPQPAQPTQAGRDEMSDHTPKRSPDDPQIRAAVLQFLSQNSGDLLAEDLDPTMWVTFAAAPGDGIDVVVQDDDGQNVARYRMNLTAIASTAGPGAGRVLADA